MNCLLLFLLVSPCLRSVCQLSAADAHGYAVRPVSRSTRPITTGSTSASAIQRLLPIGPLHVDIMYLQPSARMTVSGRKFLERARRHPQQFLQEVQQAGPGEPLPYQPDMGLSRSEYREMLRLYPHEMQVRKTGEGTLLVQAAGNHLTLDGGVALPDFNDITIDLHNLTVKTPFATLRQYSLVKAAKSRQAIEQWDGIEWRLDEGATLQPLSTFSSQIVQFAIGRLQHGLRGRLYYRVQKIDKGKILANREWILYYSLFSPKRPADRYSVQQTYAEALASARRAGILVRVPDLQAPLPPSEQNAAPLYTQLTRLLKAHPLAQEDTVLAKLSTREMPSDRQFEQIRRAIGRRQDIFALLHQAATLPQCVFVRDWSNPHPEDIAFPEYVAMRDGVRYLTAESLLLAHDKHPLEAVQVQAQGFQIARHAASERTLISYLVGMALDAITLSGMERILYLAEGDPTVAAAVHTAIDDNCKMRDITPALQGETAFQIAFLEMLRQGGWAMLNPAPNRPARMNARTWSAYLDTNGVLILQRMRKIIAAANLPYPRANATLQTISAQVKHDKSAAHYVSSIIFPDLSGIAANRARLQARINIDSAAAAVLEWRARHNAFPQRLADTLTALPTDPFTGRPLEYRREEAGFVIYCAGSSGKFTGGTPAQKPKSSEVLFRYPLPIYYRSAEAVK